MRSDRKDIEIQLPLETLIDTLCKLPAEDLSEVKRRIEDCLQRADQSIDGLEDAEFWQTEPGREILAEADHSSSLEDVIKITSRIKGSLAQDIIAEREER